MARKFGEALESETLLSTRVIGSPIEYSNQHPNRRNSLQNIVANYVFHWYN